MVMAESIKRAPMSVGFYDIIRTIGKGNFASVKLARHRVTKTEVAIKIIEKSKLDSSNLKKVYREIQILKLLRHQHIIKLYEVIETNTTIYLVCEYASHGEVFDHIAQEERIPEVKAKKMFYQVLTAVDYCHKNNVVHRDLKAENLLLDAHDNVKLADFGFGNFFQSGQTLNTWCGSPPYAAPEVFEGKLYEGPQLDVWSLGIVLYVLVCGTFPFDGTNLAKLKERVLGGRFRIPFWMSEDCENLIRRMLAVNPKKRLTISQIKKHKWIQEHTSVEANLRNRKLSLNRKGSHPMPEFDERVMSIIQNLGIDTKKTRKSLQNSSYDCLYAIYHLLVDRQNHHGTSALLESRFSFDMEKRRPSSIAEQLLVKRSNVTHTSPMTSPNGSDSSQHKNFFFATQHHGVMIAVDYDGVMQSDVRTPSDVQFAVELSPDTQSVNRGLAEGFLHTSPRTQPPTSHSPMVPIPRSSTYLRLPLSLQSYPTPSKIDALPGSRLTRTSYRGSGGGIPLISSIEEGVEMSSSEPVNEGKVNKHQQRRHTLGVPHPELASFAQFLPNSAQNGLSPTNGTTIGNHVDSFSGSPGVSGSLEMSCDTTHTQSGASEHTSRLIFVPQVESNATDAFPLDARVTHTEKQRKSTDVSPTDFRQGRRASDGFLLLGYHSARERSRRLIRTSAFPTINQEERSENCFETSNRDDENHLHLKNTIPVAHTKRGSMTSHTYHHVTPNDVINYQPYTSTCRRRSLQVTNCMKGSGCNDALSKHYEISVKDLSLVQKLVLSSKQQEIDRKLRNDWLSWKQKTESKILKSATTSPPKQWDTGAIPVLFHIANKNFAISPDEMMPYHQISLQNTISSGHGIAEQQTPAQLLQQRRISRRLKVAQNNMNSTPVYHPLPLNEFQGLTITNKFGLTSSNFAS